MQLTIEIKDGSTNIDIASALRFQANLIEGVMTGKDASAKRNTITQDTTDDDDTDFMPKKKTAAQKAVASFDAEEVDEAIEEKPKTKKAKKVTLDDVNDACKARAAAVGGKEGRAEVLSILKKQFKTSTVTDLKPENYQAVIDAMEIE